MKHFWLDDEQQLVMDAATKTAGDYGFIGAFSVGKAWKTHVQEMVGGKVSPSDYLRAFNVTGQCWFWQGRIPHHHRVEVRALVRLTGKHATMMKLKHGGSDIAWVVADPTGESWGNMLLFQNIRKSRCSPFGWPTSSGAAMVALLAAKGFGPTLASVGNYANGLEDEWKRAFVWRHVNEWHSANDPSALAKTQSSKPAMQLAWDFDGPWWEAPPVTNGQRWAHQFWEDCQDANFRRRWGIEPRLKLSV